MKRLGVVALAFVCFGLCAYAQDALEGAKTFPQMNETGTGTKQGMLAVIDPSGKATLAGTGSGAVPTYIVADSAGNSGVARLVWGGIATCTMDSTVPNGGRGSYVVASTSLAGACHPQRDAPPAGTWVVGYLGEPSTKSGAAAKVRVYGFLSGAGGGPQAADPPQDTFYSNQKGNGTNNGIAGAIAACGASNPCRVIVPGSYPKDESVPGSGWAGLALGGTTSGNVQVQDYRYGDYQTAINPRGMGTGHQAWHYWNDNQSNPSGSGSPDHAAFQLSMNAEDGGVLYQNNAVKAYAKSVYLGLEAVTNKYTPSSDSVVNAACNNYSPGDCVPLFGSNNFYGGQNTQGEEGAEAADLWLIQGDSAYKGTVASGGTTGSAKLTLANTAGGGTQGAGRYLLDTTERKTVRAGTIAAISTNSGGTPVTFTGGGTNWPVSTVNTTTTQAITSPGAQTVTLASTRGITTSTVLLICDGTEPETLIPTAVGPGSITANFRYPRSGGAVVAAGGLTGYYLELIADTVPSSVTGGTALRQAFPVLYSTSNNSLAAAIIQQGGYGSFVVGQSTAWANSSGRNGYVLYAGTTVNSVYANGVIGDTFTLMPNSVAWAEGDTVELPHHPSGFSRLGSWIMRNWFPWPGNQGPVLLYTGVHGYSTTGLIMGNNSPYNIYSGNGGSLAAPRYGIQMAGPWANALALTRFLPGAVGLDFENQAWGSPATVYPVQVSNGAGSSDVISYDRSGRSWAITAGSRRAVYGFGPTSMSLPNGVTVPNQPFDASGFFPGKPSGSQVLWSVYLTRTVTFPRGLGEVLGGASGGTAGKGASAPAVIAFSRIPAGSTTGTIFGTCTFAANGGANESCSLASSDAVTFNRGDVLTAAAPAQPDATLADIRITLAGTRQ